MAAPPAALVEALRTGAVARHVFFRLDHSEGVVRVWDGIGERLLSGETYLGVGGLGEITGVSDSGDLQNHEVIATLNGVGLPSLLGVDLSIQDDAAVINLAWIDAQNAQLATLAVFTGTGDVMRLSLGEENKTLSVKLGAPLADWRTPPRAYYTDADQQRRYPGDTGFSFVKKLEGATVAGWSVNVEATGGTPTRAIGDKFFDDVTNDIIGEHTNGVCLLAGSVSGVLYVMSQPRTFDPSTGGFQEDISGAFCTMLATTPQVLQVGGINCYIDLNGDVRTAAGRLVYKVGTTSARRIRRQTPITANGAATTTTLSSAVSGSTTALVRTGSAWSLDQVDQSKRVYDNLYGNVVTVNGSNQVNRGGILYQEDGTGNAVTVSGGLMRCNGANCVVSATGVILTNTGARVKSVGSPAAGFLRLWT